MKDQWIGANSSEVVPHFPPQLIVGKQLEDDRVVIVKSSPRTKYQHWIAVTSIIEQAGGIITLQLEKKETISVD